MVGLLWSLVACTPTAELKVTYGDWETLSPGSPPTDASDRVAVAQTLREGRGDAVALGDLVELHLVTRPVDKDGHRLADEDDGTGWVWIGFDATPPGNFPVGRNSMAAALLGLRIGTIATLSVTSASPQAAVAGGADSRPFGHARSFLSPSRRPPRFGKGNVWADRGPERTSTTVEITRVCRGQAEQRRITLLDDSAITVSQDLGRTYETREPRWLFLREARWTGVCHDGHHVRFETGPTEVDPPPGMSRGLIVSDLWGPWLRAAWKKVPQDVIVE